MERSVSSDPMDRHLAAILAMDVVGYSRLMGADEIGTFEALMAHRKYLIDPTLVSNRGRIVKTTGDGMLAEFASAVDAVNCGIEFQRGMIERNKGVPQDRRIEFRIGINLGDIIAADNDIFGDGVNIAARLEAMAPPGGIFVSRTVRDAVRDRQPFFFQEVGKVDAKNISRRIHVFQLLLEPGKPEVERTGWPIANRQVAGWRIAAVLTVFAALLAGAGTWVNFGRMPAAPVTTAWRQEKPSLAVLAFENLGLDQTQEHISDALNEDIITELSRFSALDVRERASTLQYKGTTADLTDVGRELKARYILEGSARQHGERIRITAQLVDAETGRHIWAERYDRAITSFASTQDDITASIVSVVAAQVNKAEVKRSSGKPQPSWSAYDYFLHATEILSETASTRAVTAAASAKAYLERAVELDPGYARAYALLAITNLQIYGNPIQVGAIEAELLDKAHVWALKAAQLDANLPEAHASLGWVLFWKRQHAAAIAEYERAITLNPNFSDGRFASVLTWSGQPERAIEISQRLMRIDPFYSPIVPGYLGETYNVLKRYQDAIVPLRECTNRAPNFWACHAWLASAYVALDQLGAARAEVDELQRIVPGISIRKLKLFLPYQDGQYADRLYSDFRIAGMAE